MIIGIGIDIIEVPRVEQALARHAFRERVFTPQEQAYCEGRGRQKAQSYAARFAAKEAALKALGTGLRQGTLQEVEVIVDELGKPEVRLGGCFAERAQELGVEKIFVSLTHTRQTACAQVLLWGR